jgi:hypothetical protein
MGGGAKDREPGTLAAPFNFFPDALLAGQARFGARIGGHVRFPPFLDKERKKKKERKTKRSKKERPKDQRKKKKEPKERS